MANTHARILRRAYQKRNPAEAGSQCEPKCGEQRADRGDIIGSILLTYLPTRNVLELLRHQRGDACG